MLAILSLTLQKRTSLQHIHLQLHSGQVTALSGAKGAGKSTLFKCVAGEHKPSGETHFLDAHVISGVVKPWLGQTRPWGTNSSNAWLVGCLAMAVRR